MSDESKPARKWIEATDLVFRLKSSYNSNRIREDGRRFTQGIIAKECGVRPVEVSRWLSGDHRPDNKAQAKIRRLLRRLEAKGGIETLLDKHKPRK